MNNRIKISSLALFLLIGLIGTAQVMTPEARSKMLARAAELELKTTYQAPPRDELSSGSK